MRANRRMHRADAALKRSTGAHAFSAATISVSNRSFGIVTS
jgi:hypothetical protein